MAELSKISGVAIADVAAVDAVLKANIASILGLTLPSGAAFLLDTYTGAAAGYSVRRIASGATNLMRIREDSGDTETDIGYDSNGDLDLAAIASHCGTANGFVVSWADQSGNGNDATQSTLASQPQIYDGTSVITDNGKPAVDFDVSGRRLVAPNHSSLQIIGDLFASVVVAGVNESGHGPMFVKRTSDVQREYELRFNSATVIKYLDSNNNKDYTISSSANQRLFVLRRVANTSAQLFENGTSIATNSLSGTASTTNAGLSIGGREAGDHTLNGVLQEVILWPSQQTGNRNGIETNINSDYLIYQPTTTPTSGLLATYSGAAAAYSVRQLANTAVIAMTVRRDSDDEEKRFGFDENGDLDTAGIASFCGSANGYVSQWWDQSTNGNHASQGTFGNQPKIYDSSTGLITENGKPAVDFDGTDDGLEINYTSTFTNVSAWSVHTGADGAVISTYSLADGTKHFWSHYMASNQYYSIARNTANTLVQISTGTTSDTQVLQNIIYDRATLEVAVDGGTAASAAAALGDIATPSTGIALGRTPQNTLLLNGNLQEILVYNSDESSNRTGIETDINDYFSIF